MNCNWISKTSQLATLKDAKDATGKLITVCPKCMIHFNCAMDERGKVPEVEVEDIIVTIANSMEPGSESEEKSEKTTDGTVPLRGE